MALHLLCTYCVLKAAISSENRWGSYCCIKEPIMLLLAGWTGQHTRQQQTIDIFQNMHMVIINSSFKTTTTANKQ